MQVFLSVVLGYNYSDCFSLSFKVSAYAFPSKVAEFWGCLLMEHLYYFLFPHVLFKQYRLLSLDVSGSSAPPAGEGRVEVQSQKKTYLAFPGEPVTNGAGI